MPLLLPAVLVALTSTSTASPPEASVLALDSYRLQLHLRDLPSAGTSSALLEMIAHPATPLTEDAGGFGALDQERVSLLGESWTWTRWRIDAHDVSDPFAPGSALLHLPFAWTRALEISMSSRPDEAHGSGIDLIPDLDVEGVRAGVRTVLPDVGDIAPGAIELMNAISGKHARERAVPPPEERRRYRSAISAWAVGGAELAGGRLSAAVELIDTSRRFLDFDPNSGGLAAPYDEAGARLTAGLAWAAADTRWLLLAEHQGREHLGAEVGLSRAETMALERDALLIGLHRGDARLAVTLSRSVLNATTRGATREIHDPDGEGSSPWVPDGEQLTFSTDLGWSHGAYYVGWIEQLAWWRPQTRGWSNRLVLDGAPYGRIDWNAADTFVALGEMRAGIHDGVPVGAGLQLEWDLYAWAAHAANGRGSGTLIQADLGADLALHGRWGDVRPFLLGSRSPIAPTGLVARALAPGHLEGRLSVGDTLVDTWGGSRLDVADQLRPTVVYTGAVGFAWTLSHRWTLRAQGLVKSMDGTLWTEGGSFTEEGGTAFLVPGQQRYRLDNLDRDAPIYFGGQLQLLGVDEANYLLNFSFSVYNVVGRTPPGNGPLSNDPGILDRSTAHPTLAATALANTDADRAFLTKAVFGLRLVERLWGFVSVRHRDGQPFTFYEVSRNAAGQAVLLPDSPRGSPFVYSRPLAGAREDFRLDFDLELSWTRALPGAELRLSVLVANLLDLGNELSETQVRPARTGRGALEAQIPRSLVLSMELSLP